MAADCVTKVAEMLVPPEYATALTTGVMRALEIRTVTVGEDLNIAQRKVVERAIRMTIAATHDEENHGITKSQSQYREQRLKQVESLVCARILQALEAEKA